MIQTRDLTKVYGSNTAVDHLNLTIESGETYGFLGPNGAGKTTTLMMMLGVIKPTAGEVRIFGQRLKDDPFQIKRRLGVVTETQSFYDEMSAWEYLMFFAKLYEVEHAEQRAQQFLERVNLWQWRDVLVGGYSTGMQRKLSFVRALLHSPEILILDEPVSGLDPFGIVQIREILSEQHAAGVTILISSHILSEIERTANRVGIIAGGQLIMEDDMDKLLSEAGGRRRVELEIVNLGANTVQALEKLPFVLHLARQGNQLLVDTLNDRDYRADLGAVLAGQGVVIQGMRTVATTLEEVFITITEAYVHTLAEKKNDVNHVLNVEQ